VLVLEGHEELVSSVSFSPDGTQIVSASDDNTVRIWDVATGTQLRVLEGHKSRVDSVSFSPDGTQIVSGSWDNTVRVWDVGTGELQDAFDFHALDELRDSDMRVVESGGSVYPFLPQNPNELDGIYFIKARRTMIRYLAQEDA
jgi:WD40 repeat protein